MRSLTALGAALLVTCLGCQPEAKVVAVSGEVTYDGKPVEEGDVVFMPAEGHAAPEGGPIVGGRFTFQATAGAKKVQVHGAREVPGTSDMMRGGRPRLEQLIPNEYGGNFSTLTAEVVSGQPNRIDFHLFPPAKKK